MHRLSKDSSLKSFIDALPFYVMVVDETHHILLANKTVRETYNLDEEKIVGKFCPQIVHGTDKSYPGCPVEEAAKKGESVVKDLFFKEYNKWFNTTAYLTDFRTEDGNKVFIHFVQDITERKHMEEDLKNKIAELEKWQRLTVGREIKMAELKKEIVKLKEKLQYELKSTY